MEPLTIAAILFGSFLLLVFLRVPVAFALGLATLPVIFLTPGVTFFALIDRTYISFNSFLLLSVPFFLLAANLMNENGITRKLIDLAKVSVGHLPGGLGHINVLVSMLFAGISGSSNADARDMIVTSPLPSPRVPPLWGLSYRRASSCWCGAEPCRFPSGPCSWLGLSLESFSDFP